MRNPPSSGAGATGGPKPTPCCSKLGLKRGPWTPEEDELLANTVRSQGEGRWRTFPKRAGLLRCGKSCRLRWMNYLRPSVKRGHIAPDEEDLILRLHRLLGNRWSLIAGRIPGRTDNEIKNYWNTHLSKKLISQGIDPRTHKPLLDSTNKNDTIAHDVDKRNSTAKKKKKSVSVPESVPPNPNPLDIHTLSPYVSDESNSGVQTAPPHFDFTFDPFGNNSTPYPSYPLNFNNSGSNGCGGSPGSIGDRESDPNYCSEDVFSSFLNSLINEDLYTTHAHQQQVPQNEGLLADQPTSSSSSALAFGAVGWNAPLMSATMTTMAAAFQHNGPEDDNKIQ